MTISQICKDKYDGKYIRIDIKTDYTKINIMKVCIKTNINRKLQ